MVSQRHVLLGGHFRMEQPSGQSAAGACLGSALATGRINGKEIGSRARPQVANQGLGATSLCLGWTAEHAEDSYFKHHSHVLRSYSTHHAPNIATKHL